MIHDHGTISRSRSHISASGEVLVGSPSACPGFAHDADLLELVEHEPAVRRDLALVLVREQERQRRPLTATLCARCPREPLDDPARDLVALSAGHAYDLAHRPAPPSFASAIRRWAGVGRLRAEERASQLAGAM